MAGKAQAKAHAVRKRDRKKMKTVTIIGPQWRLLLVRRSLIGEGRSPELRPACPRKAGANAATTEDHFAGQ